MGYKVKKIYVGTKQVRPVIPPYLCFTANTANSTVQIYKTGSPNSVTLETSTDGTNWSTYTFGTDITLTNVGDRVFFRNTSETDTLFNKNGGNHRFAFTGSVDASGDINYLLNKNSTTEISAWCYRMLFNQCTGLRKPPRLPSTTLQNNCYEMMFEGCTDLIECPELPATTAVYHCYAEMFKDCTSLIATPELPATTVGNSSYSSMFYGCTSLTTATSLPATTLASNCYASMFSDCTNLETLPALPASSLMDYCYSNMFVRCSKIKLSATQTGEYQTPYRIPTTGTGSGASYALSNTFAYTGGTYTGWGDLNTTVYTSNTVV